MTGLSSSGVVQTVSVSARTEGERCFPVYRAEHPLIVPHSVRAWRELRYNRKYAEKLEKKLAHLEQKQVKGAAGAVLKKMPPKSNPFVVSILTDSGSFLT